MNITAIISSIDNGMEVETAANGPRPLLPPSARRWRLHAHHIVMKIAHRKLKQPQDQWLVFFFMINFLS